MNTMKKITNIDLEESLSCLNVCINLMSNNFLHITEHLENELNVLLKKREKIIQELERREDLFN